MPNISKEIAHYWHESAQPLASLIFVAPFLAAYELGLLCWDQSALQNAADLWLRRGLGTVGYEQQLFLPIFTCGLLLAAHYGGQHPWRVRWSLLPPMLCEAFLGGFVLVGLLQIQIALSTHLPLQTELPAMTIPGEGGRAAYLGYVGTGIYEELFFRVLLITPVAWLLQRAGESRRTSLTAAAAVSSLLFALAHFGRCIRSAPTFSGSRLCSVFSRAVCSQRCMSFVGSVSPPAPTRLTIF